MWRIGPDGFMRPLMETSFAEPYNMPRQALPEVYWQTGYVDAAWADTILEKGSMTGRPHSAAGDRPQRMDRHRFAR